ncbi:hypothetical protein [Streptomyces sp. NPDC057616]|uniref:hypothetical protein n=1 Tax=Streptomyces sp. NPDC057616 TaxID=3346183 RepID=UPI0036BBA8BE
MANASPLSHTSHTARFDSGALLVASLILTASGCGDGAATPAPGPTATETVTARPKPRPTVTVTRTATARAAGTSTGSGGTGSGTCSIVSTAGNCCSAGRFCRSRDHGAVTTTAGGPAIKCAYSANAWRWTYA